MTMKQAYRIIGKHLYVAYLTYGEKSILIIANTASEAKEKACEFFGLSLITVTRVTDTSDPQIYTI